jgi:FkbM family methyltransferase
MREVDRFYADNMFHGYVEGLDLDASSTILDFGTYKGYTTKLLSDLYKSKIYTFEPMIPFYNIAKEECAAHSNITVLPYGLGKGTYEFQMNLDGDGTSMFSKVDPAKAHTCHIRDLFEFLETHTIRTIDLLHVNIEGAEYDLLDYIFSKGLHYHIRYLIIQFHYKSEENDAKLRRYFDTLDHTHRLVYDYKYVWTKWERIV